MGGVRLQSIANACVEHNLSQTDRHTYECARRFGQIVVYLRFNQIQEARIELFCARYCYKHALNLFHSTQAFDVSMYHHVQ